MSKIKDVTLTFPEVNAPDLVGYKLYFQETPAPVSYNSQFIDLGKNNSVNINTLDPLKNVDGVFNLGVTAVDDAGNESDMTTVSGVPLDFIAPDAPGPIQITRT